MPPAGSKDLPSIHHMRSVTHDDSVYPQELIKRLLKVWNAIHVSWGKVSIDEGCPLYSGDNFTAHHVWSVSAR